jgi:hypothetical protein
MCAVIDPARDVTPDSPLSSAVLRYSLRSSSGYPVDLVSRPGRVLLRRRHDGGRAGLRSPGSAPWPRRRAGQPGRVWVNHPNRSADSVYKPLQLATAARCGLTTVPTVITNSPDAVRRLAAGSPAGVVRKSLGPNTVTEGGRLTVAFTHRLTAADLAGLSGVDATATQAQHWVNKTHEARVVVVGERMFTILIRAGSDASRVDWRAITRHCLTSGSIPPRRSRRDCGPT